MIVIITIPITVHQRDSSGETWVGSIIAALSAQREPDGLPPMMTLFIFIITTTAVIIYITIPIIFTRPYAATDRPMQFILRDPHAKSGIFVTDKHRPPRIIIIYRSLSPVVSVKHGALQQWYWLWKRHTNNYLSPRPTEVICKFPVAGFKCDTSLSFKVLLPVKTSPFVSAAQREDMCQELGLFTHSSRIFLLDKFNPLRQRHWGSVAEDRLFSDMYSDKIRYYQNDLSQIIHKKNLPNSTCFPYCCIRHTSISRAFWMHGTGRVSWGSHWLGGGIAVAIKKRQSQEIKTFQLIKFWGTKNYLLVTWHQLNLPF